MFRGRYFHTIDDKGRLSIPSKFREVMGEKYGDKLIITSFDSCLVVYPLQEWDKFEQKALGLTMLQKEVREFMRLFISSASECNLDRNGRVLIPQPLREFAQIDKEVVIIGVLNKFEIWSKDGWEGFISSSEGRFEQMAEKLSALGL